MAKGIFDGRYGGKKSQVLLAGIFEIIVAVIIFKFNLDSGGDIYGYVVGAIFILAGLFTIFKG